MLKLGRTPVTNNDIITSTKYTHNLQYHVSCFQQLVTIIFSALVSLQKSVNYGSRASNICELSYILMVEQQCAHYYYCYYYFIF